MFVRVDDHLYNIQTISSVHVREKILQLAIVFTNGEKTNIKFSSQDEFDEFMEKLK